MFTDEEWFALIAKLRQLTEEGKVTWELSTQGLSVDITDVTYFLASRDEDNQAPYVLSVRIGTEEEWQELDSLLSSPIAETANDPRTLVQPLEKIARRNALGGPELATRLLADMRDIDPSDPPKYGAWRAPSTPGTSNEMPF